MPADAPRVSKTESHRLPAAFFVGRKSLHLFCSVSKFFLFGGMDLLAEIGGREDRGPHFALRTFRACKKKTISFLTSVCCAAFGLLVVIENNEFFINLPPIPPSLCSGFFVINVGVLCHQHTHTKKEIRKKNFWGFSYIKKSTEGGNRRVR